MKTVIMLTQKSSHPLLFLTMLIVIVSVNEASRVRRGHTDWWEHTRHRTDPYQRQYLSRTPQTRTPEARHERGQSATQVQGHIVTHTYSKGQGHDLHNQRNSGTSRTSRTENANRRDQHRTVTNLTPTEERYPSQGHMSSHQNGDNVAQGHRDDVGRHRNRDNVDRDNAREVTQGHTRDNVHVGSHRNRDNVGEDNVSRHSNRDNVRRSHGDNVVRHSNRDNVGQTRGDNVARHSTGDNVDNVDQRQRERDNFRRSHSTNRDNVDYPNQGEIQGRSETHGQSESERSHKQNIVFESQQTTGQRSPQCSYSFVVNELDSSKCPMLLHQLQQQQNNNNHQQHSQRTTTHNFQGDQDILSKYYENMNMNKEIEVLITRIDMLENKLLREVAKNRELENDMLELENQVKRQQKVVDFHKTNISNIATVVKRGEILQQKQMGYWKNVDTKLSGVMLDVVELNNRLDRQDSIMNMNDEAAKSINVQATGQQTCTGVQNATRFKDCEDLYHNGHKRSGVYYITPIYAICPIPVYCDMETPPGGWLVIQRRMDGSVSFNQSWAEYRNGFGNVAGEHWIGNDNLFLLTNQLHYALRVDLYDFYNSRVYAEYRRFKVDGERDRYMLHIANHTGTAPDGFSNHNKVKFSTPDQDHDEWKDYHCAKEWGAGWWFNNCWFVILNGPYYNVSDVKYRGIAWNDWKSEQLKRVEMKIRPAGF